VISRSTVQVLRSLFTNLGKISTSRQTWEVSNFLRLVRIYFIWVHPGARRKGFSQVWQWTHSYCSTVPILVCTFLNTYVVVPKYFTATWICIYLSKYYPVYHQQYVYVCRWIAVCHWLGRSIKPCRHWVTTILQCKEVGMRQEIQWCYINLWIYSAAKLQPILLWPFWILPRKAMVFGFNNA